MQVAAGTVVVIKSNSGLRWTPADGKGDLVNGVPLVPRDHIGVWSEPLTPGGYYLNTNAYVPTVVKTSPTSAALSATRSIFSSLSHR